MHIRKIALAAIFAAVLALSVVSSSVSNASALSAVTMTTKTTVASQGALFQRVYENATNALFLDTSSSATYFVKNYNVAGGTATSSSTTISNGGSTANGAAFLSPVETTNNVWAVGRDSSTGKNVYALRTANTLSAVNATIQTSSYTPMGLVQSKTKLYSPLFESTTYGKIWLGSQTRAYGSYAEAALVTGDATTSLVTAYADTTTGGTPYGPLGVYTGGGLTYVTEKATATSALIGVSASQLTLRLAKSGTPTGTATIGVWDNAGTLKFTFGTQDVSLLTGTETSYTYTAGSSYTFVSGDRVGIYYNGGSGVNYVNVYATSDIYNSSNSILSFTDNTLVWTDDSAHDLRFKLVSLGTAKSVVYDGSPDTVYIFYETNLGLKIVKYTSSASVLSGTITHSSGSTYQVIPLTDRILIQNSNGLWQLLTGTDALSQLYSSTFTTRYPQPFTINPNARTYNSNGLLISNSTYAAFATPNTGSITQTYSIIQSVNDSTGALTVYNPSAWYYLPQNTLSAEGPATTWTIKAIGTQVQIAPTAYSEKLGVNLQSNSTLFSQDVFRLVCGTASYHVTLAKVAIGSDSDCAKWDVLPSSSNTNGRELYIPYSRTQDLVHTSPMTSYTFTINSGTPTNYYLKSSYGGKVVDVANFDSSGQAAQRYLYGQCYTVSVTNTNTGQTALAGNICANDVTTKPIDVNAVSVPVNWQGTAWAYNTNRNYTTPTNNIVTFVLQKNQQPWNASIHVVDNQFATPGFDQWYNYTNQSAAKTVTISGINGNQTLYFNVFENGNSVINAVVSGQGFNLNGLGFTPLGSIFGVPIAGMFVVIIGGVFTRANATFGFIAVLATIGIMGVFGLLTIPSAFWAALMGMAAVGIFMYKRYN